MLSKAKEVTSCSLLLLTNFVFFQLLNGLNIPYLESNCDHIYAELLKGVQLNRDDSQSIKYSDFDFQSYIKTKLVPPGKNPFAEHTFNQTASDYLDMYRQTDILAPQCKNHKYNISALPRASIIITFHNEARSTLIRSLLTIFRYSPPQLLHEIILIDDDSSDPSDGAKLDDIEKVHLFRNAKREGLMRSRMIGAGFAEGDVLVFLDSHIEANERWLEPLLLRIDEDYRRVVSPCMDAIEGEDFKYVRGGDNLKGGYSWNLIFTWLTINEKDEELRGKDPIGPITTPAFGGGLYAIAREWFDYLGGYDTAMNIWGAENIEMSWRVWQCGGSMEIIPCSHVGHVFRQKIPFSFGPRGNTAVVTDNFRRAAEVWMDYYIPLYLEFMPLGRTGKAGDISDRIKLREKLKCGSFRSYLAHVYPDIMPPDFKMLGSATISQRNLCLSIKITEHVLETPVHLSACLTDTTKQTFQFSYSGILVNNRRCLIVRQRLEGSEVIGGYCKETPDPQLYWELYKNETMIRLADTDLCLDLKKSKVLSVQICNSQSKTQIWKYKFYNLTQIDNMV